MDRTEQLDRDATLSNAFFKARPTLDGSDEEDWVGSKRRRGTVLDLKGKGRAGWSDTLGWQTAPPKGQKRGKGTDKRRRHRSRRVVRALDDDLDAFNAFAQNGHSRGNSGPSSYRTGSIKSDAESEVVQNASGALDRPRAVLVGDGYDAVDVMADQIFRIGVQQKKWFQAPRMGQKRDRVATGVSIRVRTGLYRTFPVGYEALDEFEEAVTRLNPEVAIKIRSKIITSIMDTYV
jgi:hypothetical protein